MARCKYCGKEGLEWVHQHPAPWELREMDDDELHQCTDSDRKKEYERVLAEKAQTDIATKKYREANGYL